MKMTKQETVPNSELHGKSVIVHRIVAEHTHIVSKIGVVVSVTREGFNIMHPGETMFKHYTLEMFNGEYDEDGAYHAMDLVAIGKAVEFE